MALAEFLANIYKSTARLNWLVVPVTLIMCGIITQSWCSCSGTGSYKTQLTVPRQYQYWIRCTCGATKMQVGRAILPTCIGWHAARGHYIPASGASISNGGISEASSGRRNAHIDPLPDVREDDFLVDIAEQVVKMPLIEFQCLVGRAGHVIKVLAAAGPGDLVICAVHDQHRQGDLREPLLQPLVAAQHRCNRLGWLHLVRDERVALERLDHFRIPRETVIIQPEHVGIGHDMAQTLQHSEGDIRRRQLVCEALADQAGELGLMVERIHAGDYAAGAVAEQEDRQSRMLGLRHLH